MRRPNGVNSLLASGSLDGSLLGREAELIRAEGRLDAPVEDADLVILPFLVQLALLVVLHEPISCCDASRVDFGQGVFGAAGRLQTFIVLLDGYECVKLLLDGGHR